jgi:proton-dependent oligopeptide transporter, POT family
VTGRRLPPQIKYIVGNEAAERFSFYGMSGLLTLFMTTQLGYEEADAESNYHLFVFAAFFTPLLGAWLSDRFWGKYPTIIALSLVYCAGHAVLGVVPGEAGLFAGLGLIALGAGGIKPCVSAHAGDQLQGDDKALTSRLFGWWYVSINVGSFLAFLVVPWAKRTWGHQVAFAVPGVLMVLATLVFWLGRHQYVRVPPTRQRASLGDVAVIVRAAIVLVPAIVFWALYFQTASSWVITSSRMNLHGWIEPEMLQAANAGFILILVPLFDRVVYPGLERRGVRATPLRRIGVGLALTALSFVGIAALQWQLDGGGYPSALWILGPYLVLTAGETLVSVTGLEFAYTQAPAGAKSTLTSLWLLTIAFGNLLASVIARLELFDGAPQFLFWAGLMAVTTIIYGVIASSYREA